MNVNVTFIAHYPKTLAEIWYCIEPYGAHNTTEEHLLTYAYSPHKYTQHCLPGEIIFPQANKM